MTVPFLISVNDDEDFQMENLPVEECISAKSNEHYEANQSHTARKKRQGFYVSTCFQVYESYQQTLPNLSRKRPNGSQGKGFAVYTKPT